LSLRNSADAESVELVFPHRARRDAPRRRRVQSFLRAAGTVLLFPAPADRDGGWCNHDPLSADDLPRRQPFVAEFPDDDSGDSGDRWPLSGCDSSPASGRNAHRAIAFAESSGGRLHAAAGLAQYRSSPQYALAEAGHEHELQPVSHRRDIWSVRRDYATTL